MIGNITRLYLSISLPRMPNTWGGNQCIFGAIWWDENQCICWCIFMAGEINVFIGMFLWRWQLSAHLTRRFGWHHLNWLVGRQQSVTHLKVPSLQFVAGISLGNVCPILFLKVAFFKHALSCLSLVLLAQLILYDHWNQKFFGEIRNIWSSQN